MLWVDCYRRDTFDVAGAGICLIGVGEMTYAGARTSVPPTIERKRENWLTSRNVVDLTTVEVMGLEPTTSTLRT